MTDLGRIYTPEEVAERYHRSVATVNRWVRDGRITAIHLGGRRSLAYAFRNEDLRAFEERNLVGVPRKAKKRPQPTKTKKEKV